MRYFLFHYIVAASCAAVASGATTGFLWMSVFGLFGPFASLESKDGFAITPWHAGVVSSVLVGAAVVLLMWLENPSGSPSHKSTETKPEPIAPPRPPQQTRARTATANKSVAIFSCEQCGHDLGIPDFGQEVVCSGCGAASTPLKSRK